MREPLFKLIHRRNKLIEDHKNKPTNQTDKNELAYLNKQIARIELGLDGRRPQ